MNLKRVHRNFITNLIIISFFAVVFFAAVISPLLYSHWVSVPFIGGFIDPTLHFRQFHKPELMESWSANDLKWGANVELISLDTENVNSQQDIQNILSNFQPGDTVTASVIKNENELITAPLQLTGFSSLDSLIFFYLPYLTGWACFISGIWILGDRRWQTLSTAYAVLSSSLGLIFFSWFDYYSTHTMASLLYIGLAMASGALVQIAILAPRNKRIVKNPLKISYIGYPINLLIVGLGVFQLNQPDLSLISISPLIILIISIGLSAIGLVISLFILINETLSPHFERHTQTILGATLLSSMPYSIHLFVSLLNNIEPLVNPLILLPLCILPITLVILQRPNDLPKERKIGFRIMLYLFLAFIFGVFFSLILFIINSILITPISIENPFVLGCLIFCTVLIFYPVRKRIEEIMIIPINLLPRNNIELALKYSETLSASENLETASKILYDAILEIINPEYLFLFLYDSKLSGYVAIDPYHLNNPQHLFFSSDSNLAETLKRNRSSIYLQKEADTFTDVKGDASIFDRSEAHLHVPIPGTYDLLGWISLGEGPNKSQFGTQEISLLESLTIQFSLIYERAHTIESLSHHLKEMEILHKIAVSINRINDIDTLLITISDHIQHIIKFDQISLVMRAETTGAFQRQFLYHNQKVIISSQEQWNLRMSFLKRTLFRVINALFRKKGKAIY